MSLSDTPPRRRRRPRRETAIATCTIHRASDMTPDGRKAIAAWLRRQAASLVQDGPRYAARFTARYLADGPECV